MKTKNIYEEQEAISKLSTDELRNYAQTGGGMTGILSAMELSRRAQMNRAAAGAAVTQRVRNGGGSVLSELANEASQFAPAPRTQMLNNGGIVQHFNPGSNGPVYNRGNMFTQAGDYIYKTYMNLVGERERMQRKERDEEDRSRLMSLPRPLEYGEEQVYYQTPVEDRDAYLMSLPGIGGIEAETSRWIGAPGGAAEFGGMYKDLPPLGPAGPAFTPDPEVVEEEEPPVDVGPDPLELEYEDDVFAGYEEPGAPESSGLDRDQWSRGVALLTAASRIANGGQNDLGNIAAGLAEGGTSYADAMQQLETEAFRNRQLIEQQQARYSREDIAREQGRSQRAIAEYEAKAEARNQAAMLDYYNTRDIRGGIEAAEKTYQTEVEEATKFISDAREAGTLDAFLPTGKDGRKATPEEYLMLAELRARRRRDAMVDMIRNPAAYQQQ